jgi:hypothetical protein
MIEGLIYVNKNKNLVIRELSRSLNAKLMCSGIFSEFFLAVIW